MENDHEHSTEDEAIDKAIKKEPVAPAAQPEPPQTQPNDTPSFTLFPALPPELRIMIYQAHMDEYRTAVPVRTLELDPEGDTLLMLTRHGHSRELWQTSPEARYEVERLSAVLPALRLTFEGANVYNIHTGSFLVRPRAALAVGPRPTHRDTVFYVSRDTAQRILWQPLNLPLKVFPALRNLLLDNRVFVSILHGSAVQRPAFRHRSLPRPDALLTMVFPNLQSLLVGFTHRWQEVVLVEGARARDVMTRVDVFNTAADVNGASPTWQLAAPVPVHPGLEVIIVNTVSGTHGYVERMRGAGVEVIWVLVQEDGILRRREVIEGYGDLASAELGE